MANTLMLKHCPGCGGELELTCFHKDKSTADGLAAYCKVCRKIRSAARYARPEVKARVKSYQAQYYLDNTERIKERTAAYAREHPEIYRKALIEWHQRNPDYRREYVATHPEIMQACRERFLAKNPEYFKIKQSRRRAVKKLPYTAAQLRARLSMFAGCWVCGGVAGAIDHVKPLAKGGWDCLSNLRPICGACNSRKSAKWPFSVTVLRGRSYR